MSDINASVSRVRSLLLNPKEQAPTPDQVFTNLTYEYQQIYNELDSTNLPWTYHEQTVNVNGGGPDYLVTEPTGKVLFVTANPGCDCHGAIPLEFADLADISSTYRLFSPLDYGYSRDFNENGGPWTFGGLQIAFYRKDDGQLWFRLAPDICCCSLDNIKIVYSTGDWISNLSTDSTALLSQHHQLPETRTAQNLLPASEWLMDESANQARRANLDRSLARQEERYAKQFMYAKRMIHADESSERATFGESGWGAYW